jgi:hypothetical protein
MGKIWATGVLTIVSNCALRQLQLRPEELVSCPYRSRLPKGLHSSLLHRCSKEHPCSTLNVPVNGPLVLSITCSSYEQCTEHVPNSVWVLVRLGHRLSACKQLFEEFTNSCLTVLRMFVRAPLPFNTIQYNTTYRTETCLGTSQRAVFRS